MHLCHATGLLTALTGAGAGALVLTALRPKWPQSALTGQRTLELALHLVLNFDAQRSFIEESSLYSCRICICICDTFSSLLES